MPESIATEDELLMVEPRRWNGGYEPRCQECAWSRQQSGTTAKCTCRAGSRWKTEATTRPTNGEKVCRTGSTNGLPALWLTGGTGLSSRE